MSILEISIDRIKDLNLNEFILNYQESLRITWMLFCPFCGEYDMLIDIGKSNESHTFRCKKCERLIRQYEYEHFSVEEKI